MTYPAMVLTDDRPQIRRRNIPNSDLHAPTASLPFGVGHWEDTAEHMVEQLGPCAGCGGREYQHRYGWAKQLWCATHYYQQRLAAEAALTREYERRHGRIEGQRHYA